MPHVVIVDTSVLLNLLDVPGRNQDRDAVLGRFEALVNAGANLLLPVAAVFETGNHVARIPDGRLRRRHAEKFAGRVREALDGQAPWTVSPWPATGELAGWLDDFPDSAMRGVGMGDLSIVKAWASACTRHPSSRVSIWSLDQHLASYDRKPGPARQGP